MKNPFRKKPAPALLAAFTPAVSKPRPLLIVKREALDKEDLDLHASRAKRVADAENNRRLADLADADVRYRRCAFQPTPSAGEDRRLRGRQDESAGRASLDIEMANKSTRSTSSPNPSKPNTRNSRRRLSS